MIQSHRRLLCRQIIHILLLQAQPPIHQGLAAMVAVSLPKALTTYITSQISRAVRSVDWSNDTESGASAIKALIGMAGLVKERLQTEESGPDSGSSDGGESKNAAGEITIKPPASETSIATPRYSSTQDSSRPPWESATTPSITGKVSPSPVPPESLFPSVTVLIIILRLYE
ncbi:hypothetical protein C367_01920 [Cryptococcus neoformans Ze90-1]|nr:hypothetical protein C367_01920 [Cryptococcus neoformans var. grubii Ze90-1]